MLDLKDLFNSADCGIDQSNDMLTRLYRTVLYDLRLRHSQWETKLNLYIDRLADQTVGFDKSSERGNVTKAMMKHTLTWPYFIKMFEILDPQAVEFKIIMNWKRSPFHEHAKWGNEPFATQYEAEVDLFSAEAPQFLTKVVTEALTSQNIDVKKWNDLATMMVEESRERYKGSNISGISSLKGNTVRIIDKDQATWKNLINVAQTLRPSSVIIKANILWKRDIVTFHSVKFAVGSSLISED